MERRSKGARTDSPVDIALGNLRAFYEAGLAAREQFGDRAPYGSLTKLRPSDAAKLLKARQFADPARGYSPEQFEKLCAQCRKHAFALGPAVAANLLRVPAGPKRASLQKKLIEEQWSNRRLLLEIHTRFEKGRPAAGRRQRLPEDPTAVLLMLDEVCVRWERLCKSIGDSGEDPKSSAAAKLPIPVRTAIRDADLQIKLLRMKLAKHLPHDHQSK